MRTFYRYMNNGVIAVVTEEVYEKIRQWTQLPEKAKPHVPYPGPTFTFVEDDYAEHESYRGFVTGSYSTMDRLLADSLVVSRFIYVPFSNCAQLNDDSNEAREYRTTLDQAIEAFGLVPTHDQEALAA